MSGFTHAVERAWQRPPRLLWLLWPLELFFRSVTALRRFLYASGLLPSGHPGVPVIVVGNISAGGTGKTPVVIELARLLAERGRAPAIVSRGYGGSATEARRVQAGDPAALVGDEALLMAHSSGVPVYVGRDRLAAAELAKSEGAGLVVCDDGLQHYRLRRDLEVVTIDADQGFGNGHLLPLGPLREPRERLASVDYVLHRNGQDVRTAFRFSPERFRRLGGGDIRPAHEPGFGPAVHAVAAIARPSRFFATLRGLGLEPEEHPLPDHAVPDEALLGRLDERPLVMTAKDAVKCDAQRHGDSWVLEMGVTFPAGFIDDVCRTLGFKEVPP